MNTHACTTLTDGCYRCELNRDEVEAAQQEIATEAQAVWLEYRNEYAMRRNMGARSISSQLRRREFIAGYMAANR